MTCITYRAGVMAGDTLVATERGQRIGYGPKIIRTPAGALVGVCGDGGPCAAFLKWAGERNPRDLATVILEEEFEALMVYPDGRVAYFDANGVPDFLTAPFHAIGNAREFAIGAMAMGASAERAVEVAIEHNINCGGEVTTLRLGVRPREVKSGRRRRR